MKRRSTRGTKEEVVKNVETEPPTKKRKVTETAETAAPNSKGLVASEERLEGQEEVIKIEEFKYEDMGRNCPYLDTVNRGLLDFDFERKCSVTLLTNNIYACLVCGKYYQGRSFKTQACMHSLDADHHVFINMTTGKIYCLPDNYEVIDSSLDDIKCNADPKLTEQEIINLDTTVITSRTLDNRTYTCGVVGLNNLNAGDHTNAILQSLCHLPGLRNWLLNPLNYSYVDRPASELVSRFGLLMRRIWNPHNWRSTVSPHDLLQEIALRSDKKFTIGMKGDPLDFYSWIVNTLHRDVLQARKKSGEKVSREKKDSSKLTDLFQGQVQITSEKPEKRLVKPKDDSKGMDVDAMPHFEMEMVKNTKITPFFHLQLDLPVVTLLKDEKSKTTSLQVPIYSLLLKYDGKTEQYLSATKETRSYLIVKLPKYLVFYVKRFTQNMYLLEKNQTIVNFPVDELDMKEYASPEAVVQSGGDAKYRLNAYITHSGDATSGTCSARIHHKANDKWYNCHDVLVEEILPEDHFVAEAYILFYELQSFSPV